MKTKRFLAGLMTCSIIGGMALPTFGVSSPSLSGNDRRTLQNFYYDCGILVQENWSDDFTSNPSSPFQMKRLIVQASDDFDAEQYGATEVLEGLNNLYVLQFDSVDATETAYDAIQDFGVDFVEADQLVEVAGTEGASASVEKPYNLTWGKDAIRATAYTEELKQHYYDNNTLVAVIDTGIDESTADFRGKTTYDGYDFIEDDDDPQDENGHGTHVAGIIADVTHYFSDIDLFGVKVLNNEGKGSLLTLANGIGYAGLVCADVIDSGVALPEIESEYLYQTLSDIPADTTVVTGAGDSNHNVSNAYPNTIVVTGVDSNKALAPNSCRGDVVDYCAPGVDVLCADLNNEHVYFTGSAAAAAHAAGAAALLLYPNSQLSCNDINSIFYNNKLLVANDWEPCFGFGFIQLPLED